MDPAERYRIAHEAAQGFLSTYYQDRRLRLPKLKAVEEAFQAVAADFGNLSFSQRMNLHADIAKIGRSIIYLASMYGDYEPITKAAATAEARVFKLFDAILGTPLIAKLKFLKQIEDSIKGNRFDECLSLLRTIKSAEPADLGFFHDQLYDILCFCPGEMKLSLVNELLRIGTPVTDKIWSAVVMKNDSVIADLLLARGDRLRFALDWSPSYLAKAFLEWNNDFYPRLLRTATPEELRRGLAALCDYSEEHRNAFFVCSEFLEAGANPDVPEALERLIIQRASGDKYGTRRLNLIFLLFEHMSPPALRRISPAALERLREQIKNPGRVIGVDWFKSSPVCLKKALKVFPEWFSREEMRSHPLYGRLDLENATEPAEAPRSPAPARDFLLHIPKKGKVAVSLRALARDSPIARALLADQPGARMLKLPDWMDPDVVKEVIDHIEGWRPFDFATMTVRDRDLLHPYIEWFGLHSVEKKLVETGPKRSIAGAYMYKSAGPIDRNSFSSCLDPATRLPEERTCDAELLVGRRRIPFHSYVLSEYCPQCAETIEKARKDQSKPHPAISLDLLVGSGAGAAAAAAAGRGTSIEDIGPDDVEKLLQFLYQGGTTSHYESAEELAGAIRLCRGLRIEPPVLHANLETAYLAHMLPKILLGTLSVEENAQLAELAPLRVNAIDFNAHAARFKDIDLIPGIHRLLGLLSRDMIPALSLDKVEAIGPEAVDLIREGLFEKRRATAPAGAAAAAPASIEAPPMPGPMPRVERRPDELERLKLLDEEIDKRLSAVTGSPADFRADYEIFESALTDLAFLDFLEYNEETLAGQPQLNAIIQKLRTKGDDIAQKIVPYLREIIRQEAIRRLSSEDPMVLREALARAATLPPSDALREAVRSAEAHLPRLEKMQKATALVKDWEERLKALKPLPPLDRAAGLKALLAEITDMKNIVLCRDFGQRATRGNIEARVTKLLAES